MAVSELMTKPATVLPIVAIIAWTLYLIGLVVYRLYLSPIAKFPGPRLAAVSRWYEFYYEVILKGQFAFHIDKLHKRYGPIIRVTPEELHIKDSDFWDTLYTSNPKAEKYEWTAGRFGNNTSMFTTSNYALHRIRRAALSPMFSKQRILSIQPVVQEKVDLVCAQMSRVRDSGEVLNLKDVWSAFTGDVIAEYGFGFSYDHLKSPLCKENFHAAFMAVSEFGHLALQFPWLHSVLKLIPDSINEVMNPPLTQLLKLKRDARAKIARIASGEDRTHEKSSHPTILHEVLSSDLPASEKALDRLEDEAQTVLGAGIETTAWALNTACFHIINNLEIHRKLRDELCSAIPDPFAPPDLLQLEKLPYLRGCVREGVRLSWGSTARNQRLHPTPLVYKDWVIPARTPVGMNPVDILSDPEIYVNPHAFVPERWAEHAKAPNGVSLEHYFVPFGKGARQCLGMNLAFAELFMALAAVFRRFELELYETDFSDVKLAHDFTIPSPRLDSKGVRVKVKPFDS